MNSKSIPQQILEEFLNQVSQDEKAKGIDLEKLKEILGSETLKKQDIVNVLKAPK